MNQATLNRAPLCLIAGLVILSGQAMAIDCTKPVKSDKELSVDSNSAVGAFKTILKAVHWDLNVKAAQKEVYSKYPHADQLATNDNFMYMVCTNLKDSDMPPAKRDEVLMKWHQEIFRPEVPIPSIPTPPRVNTDVVIPLPIPPAAEATPAHPHPVAPAAPAWVGTAQQYRASYLREPPSVLTTANNYFVIASSPDSAEQADAIYSQLTSKFPSVDFMIYPPYLSNHHYALMLGTWLSPSEAARVEQIGKSIGLKPYQWKLPVTPVVAAVADVEAESPRTRQNFDPKTQRPIKVNH